ncbi:MAG: MerC domain-containing protein, partial [Myxococcota bacterium]
QSSKVDTFGAACSTLCAVHCASAAIVPGVLVALGLGSLLGPAFEWAFAGGAVLLALVSIALGRRDNRPRWTLWLIGLGAAGLVAGRLSESADVHEVGAGLSIVSGLVLAVGHIASLRAQRR